MATAVHGEEAVGLESRHIESNTPQNEEAIAQGVKYAAKELVANELLKMNTIYGKSVSEALNLEKLNCSQCNSNQYHWEDFVVLSKEA